MFLHSPNRPGVHDDHLHLRRLGVSEKWRCQKDLGSRPGALPPGPEDAPRRGPRGMRRGVNRKRPHQGQGYPSSTRHAAGVYAGWARAASSTYSADVAFLCHPGGQSELLPTMCSEGLQDYSSPSGAFSSNLGIQPSRTILKPSPAIHTLTWDSGLWAQAPPDRHRSAAGGWPPGPPPPHQANTWGHGLFLEYGSLPGTVGPS
ncbi:uncharacterized protein [Callorhinus ursinus]|uniref:uncharacterized protein n=1 Tax=Callorhinus ursinus TaxID=34884 RepID=UPI003CD0448D